jgi:hypothetical protein
MPAEESFDDPYATPPSDNSALELKEEADPWAILAEGAGESPPQPLEETSTSFAAGENFSMPQTEPTSEHPILSQIQSTATSLTRTLSQKVQEVDAKHGFSQRAMEAKNTVEEKYHIGEKLQDFHSKVVKPAGDRAVETVGPAVTTGWGAVRRSIGSLTQKRDGAGVDSIDGEAAFNGAHSADNGADIRQKWASLSSAVGTKWNTTAQTIGERAEQWKEGHLQWREEHMKKSGEGQSLDAKIAGGMNWVSGRFKKGQNVETSSPEKEQSVVSTLMDLDMRNTDDDGLPSSFFKD